MSSAHGIERGEGSLFLRARERAISADRGFEAGKHDRLRIFGVGKAWLESGGDEPDLLAQLAQVGAPESVPEHLHCPFARPFVRAEATGGGRPSRARRP